MARKSIAGKAEKRQQSEKQALLSSLKVAETSRVVNTRNHQKRDAEDRDDCGERADQDAYQGNSTWNALINPLFLLWSIFLEKAKYFLSLLKIVGFWKSAIDQADRSSDGVHPNSNDMKLHVDKNDEDRSAYESCEQNEMIPRRTVEENAASNRNDEIRVSLSMKNEFENNHRSSGNKKAAYNGNVEDISSISKNDRNKTKICRTTEKKVTTIRKDENRISSSSFGENELMSSNNGKDMMNLTKNDVKIRKKEIREVITSVADVVDQEPRSIATEMTDEIDSILEDSMRSISSGGSRRTSTDGFEDSCFISGSVEIFSEGLRMKERDVQEEECIEEDDAFSMITASSVSSSRLVFFGWLFHTITCYLFGSLTRSTCEVFAKCMRYSRKLMI